MEQSEVDTAAREPCIEKNAARQGRLVGGFADVLAQYDWSEVKGAIYATGQEQVNRALAHPRPGLSEFMALISPAAAPYLEQMANRAQALTVSRFGRTMQLYAPLYLSNECQNICTYCGFSLDNKIPRKTLSALEIEAEVAVLQSLGFQHVLLVTGEANQTVNLDYFVRAVHQIKDRFANISIEVQPLLQKEYEQLHAAGVYGVLVYQETYHREVYKSYHTKGKKSNFDFRLDTPDRIGTAGMHKIGLGVLLGLEDWRTDSFFNALHLDYLQKTYWQSKYSVSFPRLRPAAGEFKPDFHMRDRDLLQLICAYRICHPELELSLSTRETEVFRDHVIGLGVTSMSAGSKTNPGGYAVDEGSLEQFEISDERSAAEIVRMIKKAGYEPLWKDWDHVLEQPL